MNASLYNVILESQISEANEFEELLHAIRHRLDLSDSDLCSTDVKRFGQGKAIVIHKAVTLNKAERTQSELNSLDANCTVSVIQLTNKSVANKSQTNEQKIRPAPTQSNNCTTNKIPSALLYQPITEKDLDLEFLSVIPDLKHKRKLRRSLYLSAPLMAMLPLLYLSFIAATIIGLAWHTEINATLINEQPVFLYTLLYLAPIIAGVFIIFFLAKPLLAKPAGQCTSTTLNKKNNTLFLSYVSKIAEKLDMPAPTQVRLTIEPKVELSVLGGFSGLLKNRFKLTIGLPLIAQLNSQQLTSLITREFAFYSGHSDKRFVWIVRSIHNWFYRASKQPDSWDVTLLNLKATRPGMLPQFFVKEAQSIVKFTRKFLSVFYRLAKVIARPVLHKLYFRADEINSHLCGVNAIRSGEAHLHFLGYGFERCQKNIKITDKTLDKDLANSISSHAKNIAEEQNQVSTDKKLPLTSAEAPPWRVRLGRLKQNNPTVLYQQTYPAKCLLPNFHTFCETITVDYYKNYCNIDIRNIKWNYNIERRTTNDNPIANYFNHLFRYDNVLTPSLLHEEYGSSLGLKNDLQISINQLRQAIPDWKKTIETLDYTNRCIHLAQLEEEKSAPKSREKKRLNTEIETLKQTQTGLLVELATVDSIINRRLSLGMSYHSSLSTSDERVQISHTLNILNILKELQPTLQSLLNNGHLLEQQLHTPEAQRDLVFNAQLKKSTSNCSKSITYIQQILQDNTDNPRLNQFIDSINDLRRSYSRRDPIALLNLSRKTLEACRDLYANIIEDTVQTCVNTEQTLAIAPLRVTLSEAAA